MLATRRYDDPSGRSRWRGLLRSTRQRRARLVVSSLALAGAFALVVPVAEPRLPPV